MAENGSPKAAGTHAALPPPDKSPALPKAKDHNIRVSPAVLDAAGKEGDELLESLGTSAQGLTQAEADVRMRTSGPNEVAQERQRGWFIRLLIILRNPLVILLAVLSSISFATGDARAGTVMAGMVVLSAVLRFVQEARADSAAAKLKAMIHVTATVVRDGKAREIPLRDLVPGDIISLSAGDMIPGDVRVIAAKDLFVSQGTLTGESLPVEKFHDTDPKAANSPAELKNICFMGTSVQSGTATAVIVVTGVHTYLGTMASSITEEEPPTSFDQGLSRFTWLMIQLMAVMVPLVFLINGFTKHDWRGAFFFAMAVAVGLTPEMLPMIVSVCLSKGALAMSRKRVIVKRLNAIQNFGGMDVLCTDKTGTLTEDRVVIQRHCNVAGRETDEVLLDGYLISHFQTGLKNLLDTAILHSSDLESPQKDGKLTILYLRPLDLSVDETMQSILDAVQKIGAKRLVIDSLAGFEMALSPGFRADFRESLYRMIFALTGIGVTILSTVEVDESFTEFPFSTYSISFLCDDILRLRYVSIDGQLRKIMVVIKMRGGNHAKDIREYEITSKGVVILGKRLTEFQGLISGIPMHSDRSDTKQEISQEPRIGK